MAYWQTECVEVVRVLINDMASTPTYTDDRLERLIVVAALQLIQEVSFTTTYEVDISEATISPDPSNVNTKDPAFINLVCLKAAVILLDSEARYYAIGSFMITDGPSSINTTSRVQFVKEAGRILNDKYALAKMLYQSGQAGAAILTPYTVENLYPDTRFQ